MLRVRLSEDTELVSSIREKLKENNDHCPCALKKTEDTKCMCKDFRDMIESKSVGSYCHCGLYHIVEEEDR